MKYRLLIALLVTAAACLSGARADEAGPAQWIVVVAPGLRATIEPLCELRERQGFEVQVVQTTDVLSPAPIRSCAGLGGPALLSCAGDVAALRDRVRALWRAWNGKSYVLLVGVPFAADGDEALRCVVPALPGTVARMVGEPSDNGYGCADGELLARVAVGRFPARSELQAAAMVSKTLAWETARQPGAWKREFVLLAGAPSFNPIADRMIENLAMSRLGELTPVWFGQAIYHNENSYLSLPDGDLLTRAKTYLQAGPALTLYLGHSGPEGLWHRWVLTESPPKEGGDPRGGPGSGAKMTFGPAFSREDWAEVEIGHGGGIFATIGCNGAQLRGQRGEGYGVYAIRNPRGPVAVIGSHGICWSNMAMLFTEGLLRNLPDATESPHLGDVWLAMKRHLAEAEINPVLYRVLDAVDGDTDTPQSVQRDEHQEMFLLLGDPAIRFPAAAHDMKLHVSVKTGAKGMLKISGTVPAALAGAQGYLRLERTLTSTAPDVEPLSDDLDSATREKRMRGNHEKANRFVLWESPLKLKQRDFEVELKRPESIHLEELVIRVYLAKGAAEVLKARRVSSPPQNSSAGPPSPATRATWPPSAGLQTS